MATLSRITCAIIDDEPFAHQLLIDFIERKPLLHLIGAATNAQEAQPLIDHLKPDLLFLDMQMPRKSGFELLQSLTITPIPLVVATTAHADYALQGYDFALVDYLMKPIAFSRFEEAIERVQERLGIRYTETDISSADEKSLSWTTDSITVKVGSDIVIIPHIHIRYVESFENYVRIKCIDGKSVLSKLTLSRMDEVLPSGEFLRISRSHIIRMIDIERVVNSFSKVELRSGTQLPIGATYRPFVKEKLTDLLNPTFFDIG